MLRFLSTYLHPRNLISSCLCVLACILASLHPHIPLDSYMLACILLSSHPHILRFMCACWYLRILRSLYPQVHLYLPVCSHPQVNVFSMQTNNCILAFSSSLFLGNCLTQLVNNLQILRIGQAFVLYFYRTSRNGYRK